MLDFELSSLICISNYNQTLMNVVLCNTVVNKIGYQINNLFVKASNVFFS